MFVLCICHVLVLIMYVSWFIWYVISWRKLDRELNEKRRKRDEKLARRAADAMETSRIREECLTNIRDKEAEARLSGDEEMAEYYSKMYSETLEFCTEFPIIY